MNGLKNKFFLLLIITLSAQQITGQTVVLKKHVEISGNCVHFDDIAFFYGGRGKAFEKNVTNESQKCLMPVPLQKKIITVSGVKKILDQKGILYDQLKGSKSVVLLPVFRKVSKEELTERISTILRNKDRFDENIIVSVKEDIFFPENSAMDIRLSNDYLSNEKAAFFATIANNEISSDSIEVIYTLKKKVLQYHAASFIKAGERIDKSKVVIENILVNFFQKEIFDQVPVGYEALEDIQEGNTLDFTNIKKIVDINRYDKVKVILDNPLFYIEFDGIAREEGAMGQNIEVTSLKNKKAIITEIQAPGIVRIIN